VTSSNAGGGCGKLRRSRACEIVIRLRKDRSGSCKRHGPLACIRCLDSDPADMESGLVAIDPVTTANEMWLVCSNWDAALSCGSALLPLSGDQTAAHNAESPTLWKTLWAELSLVGQRYLHSSQQHSDPFTRQSLGHPPITYAATLNTHQARRI